MIKHIVNKVKSFFHEAGKNSGHSGRSPLWPKTMHEHLKLEPTCKACGGNVKLQVHHKKPFHLHPELELDQNNLITLCMVPDDCHLYIGHGDNFKCYNNEVVEDSAKSLSDPSCRKELASEAKKKRLMA